MAAALTDDLLATRRRNTGKNNPKSRGGGNMFSNPRDAAQPPELDRLGLMEC